MPSFAGPNKTKKSVSFNTGAKQHSNHLKQLATLWQEPDKSQLVYVAIDAHAQIQDRRKIADIGLSAWCPDNTEVRSFHWRVKDNVPPQSQCLPIDPELFLYGITDVVDDPTVGPLLEEVFQFLAIGHPVLCVVGHNIRDVLDLLRHCWEVPYSSIILDTEKIWQAQHEEANAVSLSEALENTLGITSNAFDRNCLGNAGNSARHVLMLLQALGRGTQHLNYKGSPI
ncbi:hypothetical protein F5B19DRAFT_252919 [Rostrohypoxylon terebratum]|nr:hypothetical protein F5B19DRAFT_252919 [Rostrohypoxylon terebratum]